MILLVIPAGCNHLPAKFHWVLFFSQASCGVLNLVSYDNVCYGQPGCIHLPVKFQCRLLVKQVVECTLTFLA
jgi:hypothetical protein